MDGLINVPAPKKLVFWALATFRTITTKSIKQVNPLAIECMMAVRTRNLIEMKWIVQAQFLEWLCCQQSIFNICICLKCLKTVKCYQISKTQFTFKNEKKSGQLFYKWFSVSNVDINLHYFIILVDYSFVVVVRWGVFRWIWHSTFLFCLFFR